MELDKKKIAKLFKDIKEAPDKKTKSLAFTKLMLAIGKYKTKP